MHTVHSPTRSATVRSVSKALIRVLRLQSLCKSSITRMFRAKLRLAAMSGAAILSSSYSLTLKNPNLSISSNQMFFNEILFKNSSTIHNRFANASLRCFASAATFDRVRVQNPIVEMDGKFDRTLVVWYSV